MPKRAQVIVDDYLQRIVSGQLVEGELLPTESAMIEQYDVSRTAVREAVQTLAHKGFVRIRQGSGSTVTPRSSWNVLDSDYLALTGGSDALTDNLAEARDIIEPAVASLAASHATPEQIQHLRQVVDSMTHATDSAALAKLDRDFHGAVAEASANRVVQSLLNSLAALATTAAADGSAGTLGATDQTATWSGHVVDAIAAREPDAARDAMRMHLRKLHRS